MEKGKAFQDCANSPSLSMSLSFLTTGLPLLRFAAHAGAPFLATAVTRLFYL